MLESYSSVARFLVPMLQALSGGATSWAASISFPATSGVARPSPISALAVGLAAALGGLNLSARGNEAAAAGAGASSSSSSSSLSTDGGDDRMRSGIESGSPDLQCAALEALFAALTGAVPMSLAMQGATSVGSSSAMESDTAGAGESPLPSTSPVRSLSSAEPCSSCCAAHSFLR